MKIVLKEHGSGYALFKDNSKIPFAWFTTKEEALNTVKVLRTFYEQGGKTVNIEEH